MHLRNFGLTFMTSMDIRRFSGPVLSSSELWEISGHWGHYKGEQCFVVPPANDGDKIYALKPMNCPNAILTYKRSLHSYKDLPIRISQTDTIHRKEKSGELNGLFRVQMFRQDDAHTILAENQVADEIADIMKIADEIYGTLGLKYRAELSTRPDDYMGDIESWNKAEAGLKAILDNQYRRR